MLPSTHRVNADLATSLLLNGSMADGMECFTDFSSQHLCKAIGCGNFNNVHPHSKDMAIIRRLVIKLRQVWVSVG